MENERARMTVGDALAELERISNKLGEIHQDMSAEFDAETTWDMGYVLAFLSVGRTAALEVHSALVRCSMARHMRAKLEASKSE